MEKELAIKELNRLKEALGRRPSMPPVTDELQEQMQWRHGACFYWDKFMALIDQQLAELGKQAGVST